METKKIEHNNIDDKKKHRVQLYHIDDGDDEDDGYLLLGLRLSNELM